MSKEAFEKIAEGLREALSVARGETEPSKLHAPDAENAALITIDKMIEAYNIPSERKIGVLVVAVALATRRHLLLRNLNEAQRDTLFRKIGQNVVEKLRELV